MDVDSLLSRNDYAGAREELLKRFPAGMESTAGAWLHAELEERWGDSLFFGGKSGAAEHYLAAQRALLPAGMQFSSRDEYDRRMEAYGRIGEKLYGIDPSGVARPEHSGKPHPNFRLIAPEPVKPSIVERRAAVAAAREIRERGQTAYAQLFRDAGHWGFHDLGNRWCDAGKALSAGYPDAARQAFDWSQYYYGLYRQQWSAHLPASRWDSDGGAEMQEVDELMSGLAASGASAPSWAEALLEGDWERAKAELGDATPTPEFEALGKLLASCK